MIQSRMDILKAECKMLQQPALMNMDKNPWLNLSSINKNQGDFNFLFKLTENFVIPSSLKQYQFEIYHRKQITMLNSRTDLYIIFEVNIFEFLTQAYKYCNCHNGRCTNPIYGVDCCFCLNKNGNGYFCSACLELSFKPKCIVCKSITSSLVEGEELTYLEDDDIFVCGTGCGFDVAMAQMMADMDGVTLKDKIKELEDSYSD